MRKAKTAAVGYGHRPAAQQTPWEEWISTGGAPAVEGEETVRERIARLAYSYWESRGCAHGLADEDWYRAEAEVRRER